MSNIRYAIQGLRNGEWITYNTNIKTAAEARTMIANVSRLNPTRRYRLRWFALGEPIIAQWSQPRKEW